MYPKHLYKNGKAGGEVRFVRNEKEEEAATLAEFHPLSGFQEFPKSLYKDGDRTAEEVIVRSAKDEAVAKKKGFKTIHDLEKQAA